MATKTDPDRIDPADVRTDALDGEVLQRLRVGVGGILVVLVAVGIAHVIFTRALQSEQTAVPQAAATVEPSATPSSSDPLSDVGVVPDLPAQAEEEPVPEGPVLPETGEGAPVE